MHLFNEVIDLGAQFNLRDRRGNTALVIAVRQGFKPVTKNDLIVYVNRGTRNCEGFSMLSVATYHLKLSQIQERSNLHSNDVELYDSVYYCGTNKESIVHNRWMLPSTLQGRTCLLNLNLGVELSEIIIP